jgi:hypothetical protein
MLIELAMCVRRRNCFIDTVRVSLVPAAIASTTNILMLTQRDTYYSFWEISRFRTFINHEL